MVDDNVEIAFFRQILADHSYFSYSQRGQELFSSEHIRAVPLQQALGSSECCILIPSDISSKPPSRPVEMIDLFSVSIPIWDRFDFSLFAGWTKVPSVDCPLFFVNDFGTVVPAWNLFGIVTDLLGFVEERDCVNKDEHNRIPRAHNSLAKAGIDMYPVLNQMFFAVLAAAKGIAEGIGDLVEPGELIRKPVVVFSHDCDQLRGNDFYTQGARMVRAVRPLIRARLPDLRQFRWVLANMVRPNRYYFDDALAMIDLERQYGFRSVFYILNGPGGRYGARTKFEFSKKLIERCPSSWEIGCHYNYWVANEPDRLSDQMEAIVAASGRAVRAGRAHYLAYDSRVSPDRVLSNGIRFDESIGYAECAGFRCGYAGVFRPLNSERSGILNMWELPLVFMDVNTVSKGRDEPTFEKTFSILENTGGVISVLFHPGHCNNPEYPELLGRYHEILRFCHSRGARNFVPSQFVDKLDQLQVG
jgi:peptidoglycan/xylan/chitin deacetylase (PgdA/CDA1 family)